MNDVVITGIGIVSPFGIGKEPFVSALGMGARVKPGCLPELRETPLAEAPAGLVPNLENGCQNLDRKLLKCMSTAAIIGCLAGKEAAEEASILNRFAPERIGIYAATGLTAARMDSASKMLNACLDSEKKFSAKLFGQAGLKLMNPLESFKILPNMPPCILSIVLGIKGPSMILNPWEGQSACAMWEGLEAVRTREVDCALIGAADTPSSPSTMVYLKQMGFIADDEFPSAAGAYLTLELRDKAAKDNQHSYGVLHEIEIKNGSQQAHDPLAKELGRTYAAAPVLLLAANCLGVTQGHALVCTRGISFNFKFARNV
jgi:3-oxoacyl-(acyl-carrier-protein) synthase